MKKQKMKKQKRKYHYYLLQQVKQHIEKTEEYIAEECNGVSSNQALLLFEAIKRREGMPNIYYDIVDYLDGK